MPRILDRLGSADVRFRPRSVSEFFALQLARRLDSPERLGLYLRLVESHTRDEVLTALVRAGKHPNGIPLPVRVEHELQKLASHHEQATTGGVQD